MRTSAPQSSPENRGLIARLQALPEPIRRRIAAIMVAILTLVIVVAWLLVPKTPKNAQTDDWRSLFDNLRTTWQSSQQKFGEITNSISQVRDLLSSPDASDDFKQALIQKYTKNWLIFKNSDQQFSFKYPADGVITTSTDPASIHIRSAEDTPWLQFTILPTSSPAIASSTRTWQLASSTISVTDFAQSATTTLIIETFSVTFEKL